MRICPLTLRSVLAAALVTGCLSGCSQGGESKHLEKPQTGQTNAVAVQRASLETVESLLGDGFTPPGPIDFQPDDESVPAELKAKAEKGDAEAQYKLGMKLWRADDAGAMKWFLKAADHDHAGACFYAGLHYIAVGSPEYDETNAFKFFLRGAQLNNSACACWVGSFYLSGQGTQSNATEGIQWLQRSAEQGYQAAQRALADRLHRGDAVAKNLTNAIHWYEEAAGHGDVYAQCQLGWIHTTETKDYVEGAKWYRKAAEAGDATAQNNVAVAYREGQGTQRDTGEAVKWFRKAAEQGFTEAEAGLAGCYIDGEGVVEDYTEAAKWARKAAERGNASGQQFLGGLFANGQGVPQDFVESYKWSNLAAAQGDKYAITNREMTARRMTRDQIAEAQRRSSAFVARKKNEASEKSRGGLDDLIPKFTGTGFFITDDGYLLTSAHVIEKAVRIEIITEGRVLAAHLVKSDAANDVALLKVNGTYKPVPLVPSRSAKLGDSVFTVGFPNTLVQGIEPKLTKGEVSSLAGAQDDPRHFQISVPVQPGNSGGPLADRSGNVIGIVTARLGDLATLKITGSLPQNVNYALKSSFVTAFLETLPEINPKLKAQRPAKERPFSEIADEVKQSVVLVTVY